MFKIRIYTVKQIEYLFILLDRVAAGLKYEHIVAQKANQSQAAIRSVKTDAGLQAPYLFIVYGHSPQCPHA